MKEFYHAKAGFNTAILKCRNKDTVFNLHYHLFDNPVQHAWQHIHSNNTGLVTSNLSTMPTGLLIVKLKLCLAKAGARSLPTTINQELLNKLHNDYVLSNKDSKWIMINDLIHVIESKINNPFADYDSTIKFQSLTGQLHVPLMEQYKIFLNTDIKWGRMDLGYGTLGKDWLDISKNDDSIDDLAVQSTISSETVLSFCVEPGIPGTDNVKFYNWAQGKDHVPAGNLNQIALGRYPLGQVIITDVFLNFHKNPSDWYVPNHRCKLLWNKEVFNSDVEIEDITFKNTDMLYNSFVEHSKLTGLINV